jgi:predicted ArsR family transcriptional regulator
VSPINPIYKELTKKMKFEKSKFVPTLLQKIANVEQAKVMYELPNTPEEIAKKLALDKATVEKHLQYLFERGGCYFRQEGLESGDKPGPVKRLYRHSP